MVTESYTTGVPRHGPLYPKHAASGDLMALNLLHSSIYKWQVSAAAFHIWLLGWRSRHFSNTKKQSSSSVRGRGKTVRSFTGATRPTRCFFGKRKGQIEPIV